MTEKEWLECTDPIPMLHFLKAGGTSRKVLLLTSNCLRRVWSLLPQELHQWVEMAEAVAEGHSVAEELPDDTAVERALYSTYERASFADQGILSGCIDLFRVAWEHDEKIEDGDNERWEKERERQASLVRHFFGNPFRPFPAPDHWPTTVVLLADALYNGQVRCFTLADALEESGHAELADHFRQEQDHPKGCWTLDLILGKE